MAIEDQMILKKRDRTRQQHVELRGYTGGCTWEGLYLYKRRGTFVQKGRDHDGAELSAQYLATSVQSRVAGPAIREGM